MIFLKHNYRLNKQERIVQNNYWVNTKMKIKICYALALIFFSTGCGSKEKTEVSEKKNNGREIAQGNNSGSIKPEGKKKPIIKKTTSGKNSKVSDEGDDDLSNLPDTEAKTLLKRYLELSSAVPDSDERKEMNQLLSTLSSFGASASSVLPTLAKRYVVLSNSVPDSDERKEMYSILSVFSRLGNNARSVSTILTNRYKELSESVPDDEEKREMTLILQTTARIK